jgi:type I restriction enzyme S subunit
MKLISEYKKSEVGIIPKDWKVDIIKNLAEISTGGKNTQDRIDDGIYPFFVRSNKIENINSFSFDTEAVLTAGDGVGTGKVFHYINGKFDCHQRVYVIYNFNEQITGYFFYLYFSNYFLNRVVQMTAKSTVDSVRMDMIALMHIPFPPTINEQQNIVSIIKDVNLLITILEKIIIKKNNLKRAVLDDLFEKKIRLAGFNDNWETKILGNLGFIYGGLTGKTKSDFGEGNASYVSFMNIMSNPIIKCNIFENVRILPNENQNIIKKNDLFFNGSSETPDELAMCSTLLDDVDNVFLNSFSFGFRFYEDKKIDTLFLAHYFRSKVGRKLIKSLAQGSTRYNLSKEAFLKLKIQLPSLPEQNAIAQIIFDIDEEIALLNTRLNKTLKIKLAMIQKLMTGKIRLLN